jgi:hypothetical protein
LKDYITTGKDYIKAGKDHITTGKNINHFLRLEIFPLLRLLFALLLRDEEEWLLGERGGNLLLLFL